MKSHTLSGRPKRFRCHNCDKLTVKNPTQPHQRFCSDHCRYEYNKHGSAFGPLRIKLQKETRKIVKAETAQLASGITTLATGLHVRIDNIERRLEDLDRRITKSAP